MKKYISILLTIFLIPIFVNAETLTYDVCESGCEYLNLGDVRRAIENISDLTDKDINEMQSTNDESLKEYNIFSLSSFFGSITGSTIFLVRTSSNLKGAQT